MDEKITTLLQTLEENGNIFILEGEVHPGKEQAYDDARDGLERNLKAFAADSWDCDFANAQKSGAFSVNTAADGKLHAYSRDLQNGGTARYYYSLLQYRDRAGNTRIVAADLDHSGTDKYFGNSGFVSGIYQAGQGEKGTAYWLIEYHQGDR